MGNKGSKEQIYFDLQGIGNARRTASFEQDPYYDNCPLKVSATYASAPTKYQVQECYTPTISYNNSCSVRKEVDSSYLTTSNFGIEVKEVEKQGKEVKDISAPIEYHRHSDLTIFNQQENDYHPFPLESEAKAQKLTQNIGKTPPELTGQYIDVYSEEHSQYSWKNEESPALTKHTAEYTGTNLQSVPHKRAASNRPHQNVSTIAVRRVPSKVGQMEQQTCSDTIHQSVPHRNVLERHDENLPIMQDWYISIQDSIPELDETKQTSGHGLVTQRYESSDSETDIKKVNYPCLSEDNVLKQTVHSEDHCEGQYSTSKIVATKMGGYVRDVLSNGEELVVSIPPGAVDVPQFPIYVTSNRERQTGLSQVISLEPHNATFNEYILLTFGIHKRDIVLLYSDTPISKTATNWVVCDAAFCLENDIIWWNSDDTLYLFVKHFCHFGVCERDRIAEEKRYVLASMFGWEENSVLRCVVAFQAPNRKPQHSRINVWTHYPLCEEPFEVIRGYEINVAIKVSKRGEVIHELSKTCQESDIFNIEHLPCPKSVQFTLEFSSFNLAEGDNLICTALLSQQINTNNTELLHVFTLENNLIARYPDTSQYHMDSGLGQSSTDSNSTRDRAQSSDEPHETYIEAVCRPRTVTFGVRRSRHNTQDNQDNPVLDERVNMDEKTITRELNLLPNVLHKRSMNQISNILNPHFEQKSGIWQGIREDLAVGEVPLRSSNKYSPVKLYLNAFVTKFIDPGKVRATLKRILSKNGFSTDLVYGPDCSTIS